MAERLPLDQALGLAGLARLVTLPIPRDPDGVDPAAGARPELFAHALSCHVQQLPLTVAWSRAVPGGPLEVVVGPAPIGDELALLYPPGARGTSVTWTELRATLGRLPAWVRCGWLASPLASDLGVSTGVGLLEDYVAYLHDQPFAWLVVGEPMPAGEVDDELTRLRLLVQAARPRAASSEAARLEAEQAEHRFRELSVASTAGLWRVHVLAGAADPKGASRVASLLCASSDLNQIGNLLKPAATVSDLQFALRHEISDEAEGRSPFPASAQALVTLARPPRRELPGLRVVKQPTFDSNPEPPPRPPPLPYASLPAGTGTTGLGWILDEHLRPGQPLMLSHESLNRHTFVCGATGSGKSQTVRTLLEGLSAGGIPWLVIEPAKAEYAGMAGRLGDTADVLVIRPGSADTVPACLNPLEPSPGFALQTHVDLVRALFLAAFEAEEPFPQILAAALTRVYERAGWDLVLGDAQPRWAAEDLQPRYPTLGELREAAQEVVREIGYSEKITADVLGFVDVRIGSLAYGSPGRFFQGGHPLDVAEVLHRNVVLELEGIASDTDKAFLIGAVLIRLYEQLHSDHTQLAREQQGHLRHVTVVEEAHRLLKRTEGAGATAHAIELFAGLLAEIRAYGEGLVVAEQIPAKILPDVVKNSAIKIVHRLPAADDRAFVGSAMNLTDDQSEYVVTLPPGVAAVFADGMDRPLLVAMPDNKSREGGQPSRIPPLARTRSAGCRRRCVSDPCTLGELRRAERLVDDQPRLGFAAEVATIAHLRGHWPIPRPQSRWLDQVPMAVEERVLECAATQLAENCIQRRYPVLARDYPPERLIAHLAQLFRSYLLPDPTGVCGGPEQELQFTAGNARWRDVGVKLLEMAAPGTGKDPEGEIDAETIGRWRERGLQLAGRTWADQLHALAALPSLSAEQLHVLNLGRPSTPGAPPAVQSAADRCSSAEPPRERLERALSFMTDASWLLSWLYPDDASRKAPTHGS